MITSKSILDPTKLEKLLIKDWTNYINPRELLNLVKNNVTNKYNIIDPKIQTLTISYCEINQKGITLWINYNIIKSNEVVNATTEIIVNFDGKIIDTKTI